MRPSAANGLRLAALVAAAAGTLATLGAVSSSAANAPDSVAPRGSHCFWVGPFNVARGPKYNQAFPDTYATYWTARYTMPAGATLRLDGRFAHARYQSLTAYNGVAKSPLDALNDLATRPDPGSVNPYRVGAARDAEHRSYRVAVSNETPPSDSSARTPNTLYAGAAGQSDEELIYRVYVPDRGRNYSGGVGLPSPRLTLADGTTLRGADACAVLGSTNNLLDTSTLPRDLYESLRNQPGKPATFPAADPPKFGAFYSTAYTIQCVYEGICDPHPARTGGQYSNLDNAYVGAFLNRGFGHLLVLRGRLPTTPRTYDRERRMRRADLRYWSICQNQSFATTRTSACLYDEQVPVDRHRRYVIVTARRADRPSNARPRCGVGFLRWPLHGDGAGHPDDSLLFIRNMLPSPGFHRAIQDTEVPGDEREVMGPYLPRARYMSKRAFERRGCPADGR